MCALISIIVPVYNVEAHLTKCLTSILHQTFTDFEVILVDDGSTDNSLAICEKFACTDKRLKIISQSNKGPSEARNRALRHVSAPYITGIDSDDWVSPLYLETLYKNCISHEADIAISEMFYQKDEKISYNKYNDNSITILSKQEALSALFINKFIRDHFWGKLYRKELFENVQFPPHKYFEDIYIMYQLVKQGKKVIKINTPTYCYVEHPNAITAFKKNTEKKLIDWTEALLEQFYFIKEYPEEITDSEEVKAAMVKQFHHLKKEMIIHLPRSSSQYKFVQEKIDNALRLSLSEAKLSRMGILRYLNYQIMLHIPIIFYVLQRMKR